MKLISEKYRNQNHLLHESPTKYGQRGHRHLNIVSKLRSAYECSSVLDYGCGKGDLSNHADFDVQNYDPAIHEYSDLPGQADLVVCTDVLEHIEPEFLENVLAHLAFLTQKVAYIVIATRYDRSKTLPDGSNPHKIVESADWWREKIPFDVVEEEIKEGEVYFTCVP